MFLVGEGASTLFAENFSKVLVAFYCLFRNGSLSVPDLLSSRQMMVDLSLSSMKGVILVVVVNNSVIYASKPFCSMIFFEVVGGFVNDEVPLLSSFFLMLNILVFAYSFYQV